MKKGTISVLSVIAGVVVGATVGVSIVAKKEKEVQNKWKKMSNKHLDLMLLLNQWLITKEEKKSIVDYFHENKFKSIAIYGMSYVGERVYDELKNSDVTVKYAIDQNADRIYSEIDVISPDEDLETVDAIIVTPISFYDEIEESLSSKVNCPIISLEDILYQI